MYFRLMGKLNARRQAILQGEEAEKGFTLIELLVVVIIIGILAAIAIPVYLGIQDSAKDSAVKADLTNAKTAIVGYGVDFPAADIPTTEAALGFPLTTGTPNPVALKYGVTLSTNTTNLADDTTGTSGWCLVGTSSSSATPNFYISDSSGVTDAANKASNCG